MAGRPPGGEQVEQQAAGDGDPEPSLGAGIGLGAPVGDRDPW